MTTDEHQRERMRHWSRVGSKAWEEGYMRAAELADGALAEFDKRFPPPSAAAPVEPVADAHRDMTSVYQIAGPELASLRQKARLWDAVAGGKVRLEVNNHGRLFIVWYGPESRGIRTEGFPTAEEAVEAAIAAGALK